MALTNISCFKQSKDLELSLPRRILIAVLGFLDNLLFGGAVFGWPQLVYVLKLHGIYGDLCDAPGHSSPTADPLKESLGFNFVQRRDCDPGGFSQSNVTDLAVAPAAESRMCPAQDEKFALIFTLAVVCYGIPGIVVGYLLHYVGLRFTKILGSLMIALSFVCLGMTTPANPEWLFPSTALLSIGGNQVRMSSMQFGDLFPSRRSTTITFLSGVYAASASLFLVFSIAEDYGVSFKMTSFFIAGVGFLLTAFSFVLPLHHIPTSEDEETAKDKEVAAEKSESVQSEMSLTDSLRSASSLLHMYWFFIVLFCINLYQQFYNVWITASSCSSEEENRYSAYFSYSNLVSVLCAPIGGALTDHLVHRARKNQADEVSFKTREIQANFVPLLVTTIFGIGLHLSQFFFNKYAIVASLVCLIVVRPCVVAISTAYLRTRFSAKHFNRLIGVYCTVSSALMYFQYPVFKWAQHSYYMAQGLVALLVILSLSNPLHLLWTSKMKTYVMQRDGLSEAQNEKQNLCKS